MRCFVPKLFPGLNIWVFFKKRRPPRGIFGIGERHWFFIGTTFIFGMNLREQGKSLLLKGSMAIDFQGSILPPFGGIQKILHVCT